MYLVNNCMVPLTMYKQSTSYAQQLSKNISFEARRQSCNASLHKSFLGSGIIDNSVIVKRAPTLENHKKVRIDKENTAATMARLSSVFDNTEESQKVIMDGLPPHSGKLFWFLNCQ